MNKEGSGMNPSLQNAPAPASEAKAAPATVAPVRPVPISNNNQNHTDQIKSALDTLGIKLIKSEAEREVLKKLVEDTRNAQARLERELMENRKELSDTKRKLEESQKETETTRNRQERLEEKIRDATQNTLKLTRKLDADEQRRTRLQRRMERLEAIAEEAQQTLQARAMVLLTDRTMAEQSGLPMLPATGDYATSLDGNSTSEDGAPHPLRALDRPGHMTAQSQLPAIGLETAADLPIWNRPLRLNSSVAALAIVAALGLGFMIQGAMSPQSATSVAVLQDGTLARVNLKTGAVERLPLGLKVNDTQAAAQTTPDINEATSDDAATEGSVVTNDTALPTNDTVAAPITDAPEPARDETLTGTLKDLQDKAYDGLPEAMHDLAALYTAGSGVKQDYARASYWFKKAAIAGVANAAYNLGVLFHQGLGTAKNIDQALIWYRLAALQNHPEAQYNLGIASIEGIGTAYNPQLAAAFFQSAALAGITEAAYNLGLILENGLLGEPRQNQAMLWYRLGADGKNEDASAALEQLANRLSVAPEKAGFLPDGSSLSSLVEKPKRAADTPDNIATAMLAPSKAVKAANALLPDLAELIPSTEQMLTIQIQEQLQRLTLYDGALDGALSQKTMDAIKAYQKQENLDDTGKPSPKLLQQLLLENAQGVRS